METLPWRKPCFSFARSPLISSPSPSIRFSNLPRCSLNGNLFLLPLTLTRRPSQFDPKFQFAALKHTIPRRSTVVWSSQGGAAAYPLSGFQFGSRIRGICFYMVTAVVAIFLFVAMVLAHPFVLLFDRHRRKIHHFIAKLWAALTIAPFYEIEFEGLENLPAGDASAVYVSNHLSFLDIYTLLTLGRCFKFISKRGIFLFPIIGWAMYLLGVIPLRRMDSRSQLDCLKRCIELIKKGASVFFFPEGTRSKDGKLGAFKKGAFSVAAKTGAPVVPITLMGTGELMPAGMEGVVNSASAKVVIHKPIEGSNADSLCNEARNVIADTLLLHGYDVHHNV
ncbi:1-acyl-sn-glycerol-3-phosphate acyltransferase BAT2, chloroplastic-like isoform X3 [Dioscorea cayenensis subsp. rotundata]|uniref:1-acyl-sn-glycerol-3-phosphate acyltransferase BAT2, chloroplastic-like isoform X3 n=1 Tax=Dioscorea cayennensis subsp. rotundata TaxID=55577 RepID=A0AB40CL51_DIOCR|nr:1-acyl-sn-glycerol-3-phosphate acyltransferase BAT2, chloroplastic-like isoform X3 [Dioscorea cayenensis subsp. rotundata]